MTTTEQTTKATSEASPQCRWGTHDMRSGTGGVCSTCLAEAAFWIRNHADASPRLLRALDAGLLSTMRTVYVETRLQTEHPEAWFDGWVIDSKRTEEIHNAEEADIAALEEARSWFPGTDLRWMYVKHIHANGCGRAAERLATSCPPVDFKGPVLRATFQGMQIIRRLRDVAR